MKPRWFAQMLIRVYQKTLSPDHGPLRHVFRYGVCRFRPTCSEYGYEAIGKYGIFKGGWLTWKRLSKCHPWHPGGVDLVP